MAEYTVTRQAEKDINEIIDFIAADDFSAAITFYDQLLELFRMLADNTHAGRERTELREGLRSFPKGNYLIYYRTWAGRVAIARVLHSARDLDEIFS